MKIGAGNTFYTHGIRHVRVVQALVLSLCLLAGGAAHAEGTTQSPFFTGDVFGTAVRLEGYTGKAGRCVGIEGDYLYVGATDKLAVYRIAEDPLRPKLVGTLNGLPSIRQIAIQNGIVYFTARANGLWIIDCRKPELPEVIGHYPSTANCTGIDVAGDVCFIGGSMSGIEFIDVSNPRKPQLIRCEKKIPVESQSVAYRNGFLYSGEWRGRCVTIWDAHDMKQPERVAMASLASNGDGVWIDGNWLYASTGFSAEDKKPGAKRRKEQMGLEIHDITDPRNPKKVSRVNFDYCKPCSFDMWIVRASGNFAFCTASKSGLYAVDVSDKEYPRVVDHWPRNDRPYVSSVAIGDGVVYVSAFRYGTWAIPVKGAKRVQIDRGTPPVNASYRLPIPPKPKGFHRWLPSDQKLVANVTGLAVRDDICYAAAGTAGLYVLGLSDTGIKELKRVPIDECMDVSIAGNRLFAAAGYKGWIVYDVISPTEFKEIAHIPNPGARDVYAYGDGMSWATLNATPHKITDLSFPKPLKSLVNQARYNKFVSPDIIGGRWFAGNTALKQFNWIDIESPKVKLVLMKGYKSWMGGICAFKDKAFLSDRRKWAIVEPGFTGTPDFKAFPGGNGIEGMPRWNGGSLVSISGGERKALIMDFSEPDSPRLYRSFKLPCFVDPASFWRDTLVFPARLHGVLLPAK